MRLVDRVAYINHDIDDALRAGVLREEDFPAEPIAVLGDTGSRRIDALVHDLVEHSEVAGDIVQGDEVGGAMDRLRTFMFDGVYLGPIARREHAKIDRVARPLFEYYVAEPDRIPKAADRRRRPSPARHRLAGGDDRPLLHPRLRGAVRA